METYNSNCFDIFPTLKKHSVDLVCTDLPYGTLEGKEWDVQIDLDRMWVELDRICKPTCIYLFFCTTRFGVKLINSNPKMFKYDIVWVKNRTTGFFQTKKMPLRKHEMIYIFYKKSGTYNPQKTCGKPYEKKEGKPCANLYFRSNDYIANAVVNTGDRYPISVLTYAKDSSHYHTSQKPVELLENLIRQYSDELDTVLDFTMGSGSTGVACLNSGRNFIGIEKDQKIFDIASTRLEEHQIHLENSYSESSSSSNHSSFNA